MTQPWEKPPRTVRSSGTPVSSGTPSSQVVARSYVARKVDGVRVADLAHDVPVGAAGRQRERPPRTHAGEVSFRVERVEQREEVVLVGTATVQQDERAGGLAGRGSEAMAKLVAAHGRGRAGACGLE